MKMITKLLLGLVVVGVLTYFVPGLACAQMKARLEGFGNGRHPTMMLHSPFALGPLDLAAGIAPQASVNELGETVYGDYAPAVDSTFSMYDETGSGYFMRIGAGLDDWNLTASLGINWQASKHMGFQGSYRWGYVNNHKDLSFAEGTQGEIVVGFVGIY